MKTMIALLALTAFASVASAQQLAQPPAWENEHRVVDAVPGSTVINTRTGIQVAGCENFRMEGGAVVTRCSREEFAPKLLEDISKNSGQ